MRILVVSKYYPPVIGGVEITVKELCEEYARRGHQVTAAVMTAGTGSVETMNGVRVVRCPRDRLLLGGFNRGLLSYLRGQLPSGADVVHVHNFHILLSFQSAMVCRLRAVPYVFSPHYHGKGHTPLRDLLFRLYKRVGVLGLRGARAVTCASQHERAKLLRDFPALAPKCVVIPPGIRRRAPPPVPRERDRLLYVGRLMRYKGLDHVMEGMRELERRGMMVRLRVVGTGPDEAGLRALAATMGLDARVDWLGELDDEALAREYAAASCLVLLSSAEAYGLVVAEALALGTPCVVANAAALSEFLQEPGCFGVDPPLGPGEVADALSKVLEPGQVKVGPLSQKVSFWPEVASRYLRLYEGVLGERSP